VASTGNGGGVIMAKGKANISENGNGLKNNIRPGGQPTSKEHLAILHDHLALMADAGFLINYIDMHPQLAITLRLPGGQITAVKGMINLNGKAVE